MQNWTRTSKEENEDEDIFNNLEDALKKEKLLADPEVVSRWLSNAEKLYFKVRPDDKYALWDDLNATLTLATEEELIGIVKSNLEDMKTENPDVIVKMQKHIDTLNKDNAFLTFKMVQNEWDGGARGWSKQIPEGTQYIIVETNIPSKTQDGPRALFIKSEPPKEIMFDKGGY